MPNENKNKMTKAEEDAALDAILREVSQKPARRRSEENAAAERPRSQAQDSAPRRPRPAAVRAPRTEGQISEAQRRNNDLRSPEERAARSAVNRENSMRRNQNPDQGRTKLNGAASNRRPVPNGQGSAPTRTRMPQEPERRQNVNRRPAEKPPVPIMTEEKQPRRSGKAAARRKTSAWRVGMALYIIIFILAIMFGMHRLHLYLGEYESSLPQYTIDGYVTHLNTGFYSDMIRQKVEELPVNAYETQETIAATLAIDASSDGNYTWSKKNDEFTEEHPVYFIRYKNAAIATVALTRVGGTDKFDFPIWKAENPVSLIEVNTVPEYDLELTLPEGASAMINGKAVDAGEFKQADSNIVLDDAVLGSVDQVVGQRTKITGLYVSPEVKAYDSNGNELLPESRPGESETHQKYVFVPKDSVPEDDLKTRADDLTKAYINYMINKDEATWNNLNIVDQYLINGSNAYKTLHSIVQDVSWNNPYTERVDKVLQIDHFKMYSADVCTCESHFELQLTKNVVNDYVGTVRWTLVKVGNTWRASDFVIVSDDEPQAENTADEASDEAAE
ncbi:MAG: hypothetical protein MJ071_07040 [Oscillospiraceae bacterium]|nr:hypothetical protein [Oscillospiraceae bacterium]